MPLRIAFSRPLPAAHRHPDGVATVWAGITAGALFLILQMLLVPLISGGSPWGPPRMIAAIVLGPAVAQPPATFGLGIYLIALVVHFALSVSFALPVVAIARRLPNSAASLAGLAYGVLLYLVNFHLFTYLFPWFAEARGLVTLFSHMVFGTAAAYTYNVLAREHPSDVAMGGRPRAPMI